jgi:hypothetical protein
MDELQPGAMVEITKTESDYYFSVGDRARLLSRSSSGGWWSDFTMNKKYRDDGRWSIQPGFSECRAISAEGPDS